MLGWDVLVYRPRADASVDRPWDASTLARWSTGLSGLRWLEQLVDAGKAEYLGGDGYPCAWRVPARLVEFEGERLGLYSEAEAADARNDTWGDKLAWPYSITDEGRLARRTFWRVRTGTTQHFDDRFERITDLVPVAGSPTFLKGRLLTDLGVEQPMRLAEPAGLLVWHSTRIDDAGRLALSRIGADLKTAWTAELPLSETDFIDPLRYWQLRGRVVVTGFLNTKEDGVSRREPHLVSIDLATGGVQAWNLVRDAPVP